MADSVTSKVSEGVTSKVAGGVSSKMADGVSSNVPDGDASEVADCRGGAAEAACVVREMCSQSGFPADQTKKEAVTAVINVTGRETKEKTKEWNSEAQETDSEIKPILEWKEAFQEQTEEEGEEMRRPSKE